MTIAITLVPLFLTLLFTSLAIASIAAVVIGYCLALEYYEVDPDSGLGFVGGIIILLGGFVVAIWWFVTFYVTFLDKVLSYFA